MPKKTKLMISPCDYEAAKYAILNWHYSKVMPCGKLVKYGVWENDKFIGAIVFSRGACPRLGFTYNLKQNEICELVRVALRKHKTPVSQIVSITLKTLRKTQSLRLVVSYADIDIGHSGIIYQAMNWIYTGITNKGGLQGYMIEGKYQHNRTISGQRAKFKKTAAELFEGKNISNVYTKGKHKYLYPFDKLMRKQIEPLRKPYPKRPVSEKVSRTANQPGIGGSIPTTGLNGRKVK